MNFSWQNHLATALCLTVMLVVASGFLVDIQDKSNMYYLTADIGLELKNTTSNESVSINNAMWEDVEPKLENGTVYYRGGFQGSDAIQGLQFEVQAGTEGNDRERNFIKELLVIAPASPDISMNFGVKPPRFPHFQVKKDWQYVCAVELSLELCSLNTSAATPQCIEEHSDLLVKVKFNNVTFNGGQVNATYDSWRQEKCPKSEPSDSTVGILCIAAFWTVVFGVASIFIVKWLLKKRRSNYEYDY